MELFVLQLSVAAFAQETLIRSQQEQSAALASQWIHDPDPKHQAWAAYLIGRDRRTELLPLLLDRVAQYHDFGPPISAQDFEQTAAMSVVLDTLIQLDATVPVRHAMDLFPRFPAQALILLSVSAAVVAAAEGGRGVPPRSYRRGPTGPRQASMS
jgi:hypothetical protein